MAWRATPAHSAEKVSTRYETGSRHWTSLLLSNSGVIWINFTCRVRRTPNKYLIKRDFLSRPALKTSSDAGGNLSGCSASKRVASGYLVFWFYGRCNLIPLAEDIWDRPHGTVGLARQRVINVRIDLRGREFAIGSWVSLQVFWKVFENNSNVYYMPH